KYKEAIPLYEQTLADRERTQGADHPATITARGNLASAYHSGRKLAQAIPLYEQSLADCERVLGPDHTDTLTTRSNLAHAYHTVGRMVEAQAMFERTLADCERAFGPDHPLTQTARENLEAATQALSRLASAVMLAPYPGRLFTRNGSTNHDIPDAKPAVSCEKPGSGSRAALDPQSLGWLWGWRSYGGGLGAERLDIAGMHLGPPLA